MTDFDLDQIEQSVHDSANTGDWLPPDVYLTIIQRLIDELRTVRYEYA